MSQKQWGHGYYQGIMDYKNGTIGTYFEKAQDCADRIIRAMEEYENLKGDRGVKTLSEAKNIFVLSEHYKCDSAKTIHAAFNYIWKECQDRGWTVGGEDGRFLDYEHDCLIRC